jgi:ribonuclease VapC
LGLIVGDSSAVVAIFLREPDHEAIADVLDQADAAAISVVSRLELVSVLCGKRIGADPIRVSRFIDALRLDHVAVSHDHMNLAIDALLRFGKGRHPAQLNLGDCFAYALAKCLDAPLLFKGDDFTRTDIIAAWRPSP